MIPDKPMYIEEFGTIIQIRSFHRILSIEGNNSVQNNVYIYVQMNLEHLFRLDHSIEDNHSLQNNPVHIYR